MLNYKIKVNYETGDSFGSSNTYNILEEIWSDLDIVKENLQRIKEHYKWYEYEKVSPYQKKYYDEVEKPKFGNIIDGCIYQISLKLDNGKEWKFNPYWCGYFETLHSVEVILDDEELRIEL